MIKKKLFLLLLIFIVSFIQVGYAATTVEIELEPGSVKSTPLKLDEQIKVKGGITVNGYSPIEIKGVLDDKIKFWVTNPDGSHKIAPRTVDPSTSFEFTTDIKGTYTIFYENSEAFLGWKKVILTYNTEDLKPNPVSDTLDKTGGCLIATATFGSELAPQVQMLREVRDNMVLSTHSGTEFMSVFNSFYYLFSPTVADWERQNPIFKETVRIAITPLITTLSILNYVDIDSDSEMLGYGIAVILLNIGMYAIGPIFVLLKTRSKFRINHPIKSKD